MTTPRVAVVVGQYPAPELERRRAKILSYASAELEIGVIAVAPSPYQRGFGGEGTEAAVPFFLDGFRRAEAEGYDAVIPLGVLDIGVDAGRAAVDIPVIGPLQASLQIASYFGRRAGLIAYSENLIPTIAGLVTRYGLGPHIGGYAHVGTDLTELSAAHDLLRDRFLESARGLQRDHGVDVIVSAGISLCPIHVDREELESDLGVRVVEAIGAPIQVAAALARMDYRHAHRRLAASPRECL